MIEIFGTTFYVLPWSVIVFVIGAIILTSIVFSVVKKRWQVKLATAFVVVLVLFVIIYWDVYQIGREATRLCKAEGGLHVYKTVEAEGFFGSHSIEPWSKYGFKYVEHFVRGRYDSARKERTMIKMRYTMVEGKPMEQEVDAYISKYAAGFSMKPAGKSVERVLQNVMNWETKEVLGEYIFFKIYPGQVDAYLGGLIGFSFTPWSCNNIENRDGTIYNYASVVKATLKPKQGE